VRPRDVPHAGTTEWAADLACRALANIRREYPNHPQQLLTADVDIKPPRLQHPSFYGCFDWHSAVHTHWLLVRLLGTRAAHDFPPRGEVLAALDESFRAKPIATEATHVLAHPSFERPYGLAWALALVAEVAAARAWAPAPWEDALAPLAAAVRTNLDLWLRTLRYPVRAGTHNQTAFALTLIFDAAVALGDAPLAAAVRAKALACFAEDRDASLKFEPSGEDFLSPCLMEAELMSRLYSSTEYAAWLERFLPELPRHDTVTWLECAEVHDEHDGKAVHLHGLNLSRAWNLARIASILPADDARRASLLGAALRHRRAGLAAAFSATDYASDHWLPTFAGYLLTRDP
jgi:Protein of unknown function (DUF2891)